MSKKLAKEGLYWDSEKSAIAGLGSKDSLTLYLGQEYWAKKEASLFSIKSDSICTEIEIPIATALELYHCLGCMLDKEIKAEEEAAWSAYWAKKAKGKK